MMEKSHVWKVVFEGPETGAEDDYVLDFTDTKTVLNEEIFLKKEYITKLTSIMREDKIRYHFIGNIKSCLDPDEVERIGEPFYALVGTEKEEDHRCGILFTKEPENLFPVVGIWPKEFAEACKKSSKILDQVLVSFIEKPEVWRHVGLIVKTAK
ncbi:MAG: hypothetical protein Q6362_005410 [Candidatus Wukongarchaeota archaeon]|jgi:hypothetical protein|nr:hypothetical protein [Candidatus Wukongarchaeota archaeon]MDO8128864.1 hypothetical protein [Candidatus Wukongarchaeota archaeon]